MADLTNLGFESAGVGAGEAASWTRAHQAGYEAYAGFGASDVAYEDFEEWVSYAFIESLDGYLTEGVFDGVYVAPEREDFDEWDVAYLLSFTDSDILEAIFDENIYGIYGPSFDDLDAWDPNYLLSFLEADLTYGTFNNLYIPEFEDYETWAAGYLIAYLPAHVTVALFDGPVPEGVEDFEEYVAPWSATSDLPASRLEGAASPFNDNDKVYLTQQGSAPLPIPLSEGVVYYVSNSDPLGFQLAYTASGAFIPLTAEGLCKVNADPAKFWTTPL